VRPAVFPDAGAAPAGLLIVRHGGGG
jgi:hypothetical protein